MPEFLLGIADKMVINNEILDIIELKLQKQKLQVINGYQTIKVYTIHDKYGKESKPSGTWKYHSIVDGWGWMEAYFREDNGKNLSEEMTLNRVER